jgi:hypothetical protein
MKELGEANKAENLMGEQRIQIGVLFPLRKSAVFPSGGKSLIKQRAPFVLCLRVNFFYFAMVVAATSLTF